MGLQVLVKTFYSPIPDSAELVDELWKRPSELAGVELDLDAQIGFIARELGPYLDEFHPPMHATGIRDEFYLRNGSYGRGDADVLYAMLRRLKPARVLELGSGHSTLVIAKAMLANEADGSPGELVSYDPFPSTAHEGLAGLTALHPLRAQDVPPKRFEQLGDGDVLFVDTTHVVKIGGDVNFIVLDVLPRLAPGVTVHFHDVFLPWEYPKRWVRDRGLYWSEQYLLQAFLALNQQFEVVCALHALARAHPERLADLLPTWEGRPYPGAFWIRRVAG